MPVIKCDIKENDNVIEVVTQETNGEPTNLITSLEKFRQIVNATFTKMIDDNGEIDDYIDDASDDDTSDDDSQVPVNSKKSKR